jgi:hypothetical protein
MLFTERTGAQMDRGQHGRAMAGSVSGGVNLGCRHLELNLKYPFIRVENKREVRGKIQWTWGIKFVSTQ